MQSDAKICETFKGMILFMSMYNFCRGDSSEIARKNVSEAFVKHKQMYLLQKESLLLSRYELT